LEEAYGDRGPLASELRRMKGAATRRGRIHTPHLILHGVESKSCARCARVLPLADFSHNAVTFDGLLSFCKNCDHSAYLKRKADAP
jgi:hypothetical protein